MSNECFAYADRRCRILTTMKCSGCGFFKTHTQHIEERKQSEEILKQNGKWEYYKDKYGLEESGTWSGGENVRV